jgi:hypothetical protein
MKLSINRILALGLAVLLLISIEAIAGGRNRAGTNAASELLIPVGARYIGTGGASVATVVGIDAIYWNPAGLSRSNIAASAMFSHMQYIADINMEYVAVSANFSGLGTLGISIKTLSFGDIAVTTEDNPDGTGELFSPNFVTFGATYSRALTDRIGVGVTVKLISESLNRVSASGVAFDFGVQYRDLGNISGLSIGVVAKNIGTAMKYDGAGLLRQADVLDVTRPSSLYKVEGSTDELPSTLELGIGYTIPIGEKNKVNVVSLFQNNNYDDDEIKFGAEYAYKDLLFIRGGWQFAPESPNDATGSEDAYIFGPSLGGGFHYDLGGVDIALDYAWRDANFFDASNIFTISLGF